MDKKKILIGDEMGMGKSASVIIAKESIFAKEVFGIKQALVVAPNNVISTWRTYLSQENEGGTSATA